MKHSVLLLGTLAVLRASLRPPLLPTALLNDAMRGLFLTTDLMFFSRVALFAGENNWEILSLSQEDELIFRATEQPASLVLIDLTTQNLQLEPLLTDLRALDTPPQAFVAFGPHVQKARLETARQAGCDEVLTRGQFDANMAEVLGRYLT